MTYKQLKIGIKIHHVDFEDEIGIVGFIGNHYFEIDYLDKPKNALLNPYQADYSELNDFKLYKP